MLDEAFILVDNYAGKFKLERKTMNLIIAKMKWIMLVTGILTCTMLYAAIAPQAALNSTFGATLEGPLAEIVVRNWGVLITIVGAMLIYGAYHLPSRPLVLMVAIISKLIFITLLLTYGRQFLGGQTIVTIIFDLVSVSLFILYLIAVKSTKSTN